jgi:hypothetical protein
VFLISCVEVTGLAVHGCPFEGQLKELAARGPAEEKGKALFGVRANSCLGFSVWSGARLLFL